MMRSSVRWLIAAFVIGVSSWASAQERHVLVIVLDGLRPDYVTAETMPNLRAMADEGVWFEAHHSVFPTVTRVNSTSISTGSYPKTHGVMGNSIYIPEVDKERGLNTSDVNNLLEVERVTNGGLLTAPTLGEILEANGREILAVSSGSTGSAFLLNSKVKGLGVRNVDIILPETSRDDIIERIGPVPPDAEPAIERNAWVVNAFLDTVANDHAPDVTLMWLTDPDHTAHDAGIGSPKTLLALSEVDKNVGHIRSELAARGLTDAFDIIVTTDHGFTTNIGGKGIPEVLHSAGLSDGTVVVGGAIYLEDESLDHVRRIVEALQAEPSFGAIFTEASELDSALGVVPGTFAKSAIHWEHARSAPIIVTRQWNDDVNEFGYAGAVLSPGVAGHGSLSPYDVHGTMIATGKSFKKRLISPVPTSNVDIAPTVLRLLGLEPSDTMDGRVVEEALAQGERNTPSVERLSHRAEVPGYTAELNLSHVGVRVYVDSAKVTRN